MKTETTPPCRMKSDGTEFQNYMVSPQGAIKTIEPFCDGVLISYVYAEDDEGDSYLTPIISTVCKTEKYSELLTEEAQRLVYKVMNIYLEVT